MYKVLIFLICILLIEVGEAQFKSSVYSETIINFNDPVEKFKTDLSSELIIKGQEHKRYGALLYESHLENKPNDYYLKFNYDFEQTKSSASTQFLLGLRGPINSRHVTLDLTEWESINLNVKGQIKQLERPEKCQGTLITLKLIDNSIKVKKGLEFYYQILPGKNWTEIKIPIIKTKQFDPTLAKYLTCTIEEKYTQKSGSISIDDIKLVRKAGANDFGAKDDDIFLNEIAQKTFDYFWDYGHPQTGFVPDRSQWNTLYHPVGIGFQLGAMIIGAERGYKSRVKVAKRVGLILRSLANLKMSKEVSGVSGHHGYFYHLLNQKFQRVGNIELSNIDMAILSCGMLSCKQYFNKPEEVEIRELAQFLFDRIEWSKTLKSDGLFSHGWKPELPGNLMKPAWDYYTDEPQLICLMALAGNMNKTTESEKVPEKVMWNWKRFQVKDKNGRKYIASIVGSVFCHTFTSLWFSKSILNRKDKHPTQPVNWWENSYKYIQSNYDFCRGKPELFDLGTFGNTACEGRFNGKIVYFSYGSPPVFGFKEGKPYQINTPQPLFWKTKLYDDYNTVMAPYGAASSLPFTPEKSIKALRFYREKANLWRSADCGFADSYSKTQNYVNHIKFAIDAGPMLMAIDNYRSMKEGEKSVIWRSIEAVPEIQHALKLIYN